MALPGTLQWLEEAVAAIKATLSAVEGVGQVHDYERWTDDEAKSQELFLDGNLVRFWTISWAAAPATDRGIHATLRNHEFVLRGYLGVEDDSASERAFRQMVMKVCVAFQTNRKLSGKAHLAGPLSVRAVQFRRFGGTLVHYVECVLPAQEYPIADQ